MSMKLDTILYQTIIMLITEYRIIKQSWYFLISVVDCIGIRIVRAVS